MIVYLLKHSFEPIFKIGKSNNIQSRLRDIGGVSRFDIETSHYLKFNSDHDALIQEKNLHRMFDRWRIIEKIGNLSGDTEFFHDECYDRLLTFLRNNEDLIGSKLYEFINLIDGNSNEVKIIEQDQSSNIDHSDSQRTLIKTSIDNLSTLMVDSNSQICYDIMELDRHSIQNGILAKIGSSSFSVMMAIKSYSDFQTGLSVVSVRKLMEITGLASDTVQKSIVNLERNGLLKSDRLGRYRYYMIRDRIDITMESEFLFTVIMDYVPSKFRKEIQLIKESAIIKDFKNEIWSKIDVISNNIFVQLELSYD